MIYINYLKKWIIRIEWFLNGGHSIILSVNNLVCYN